MQPPRYLLKNSKLRDRGLLKSRWREPVWNISGIIGAVTTMATIMAIWPRPSHMMNGNKVASMNGRICLKVKGSGSMNLMPA